MKKYIPIIAAISLCLCATPVAAGSFGDMIAKNLCVDRSATLALSDADSARYDNTASISGRHAKAGFRTTFMKTTNYAYCTKTTEPTLGIDGTPPTMGTKTTWNIIKEGNTLREDH